MRRRMINVHGKPMMAFALISQLVGAIVARVPGTVIVVVGFKTINLYDDVPNVAKRIVKRVKPGGVMIMTGNASRRTSSSSSFDVQVIVDDCVGYVVIDPDSDYVDVTVIRQECQGPTSQHRRP